jgi:hypothetical protein
MVLVAVVARSAIDGGDSPGHSDDHVVVVCAPELADACHALRDVDVRVELPATTAAAIAAGDLADDVDAWFITDAWVEVVRSRRADAFSSAAVVATTGVVAYSDPDRADAIDALCQGTALWRCLGDHADQPWQANGGKASWGVLKLGVPDADGASGLGVLVSVAAGYFGDLDFAANDFDDGVFASWLGTLVRPSNGGEGDPLGVLTTRRGTYSAVGDTEARATTLGRPSTALVIEPPVTLRAVVVGFAGHDHLPGVDGARGALVRAGWSAAEGDTIPPLLKPGVVAALHSLWSEVTR